jgi:hypothetical protein
MAAKITTDSKLDQDLARYKKEFDTLNRNAQSFMMMFLQLPPRERAVQLQQIQGKIKELQRFVLTPQQHELTNAGTRFTLETLKSALTSFVGRWSKFEKSIG